MEVQNMKEKKVTVSAKGASVKQWSDLILELNLMKKAWQRYGVTITIQTPQLKKIMDLIILNDGLYQLLPVTKEIMEGIVITAETNCFELCDILRLKLTGYVNTLNLHIMNDGSGTWIGCMCK